MLKLDWKDIKPYFHDYRSDITMAAHAVLHHWLQRTTNRKEAYKILTETLIAAELTKIATEELEYSR